MPGLLASADAGCPDRLAVPATPDGLAQAGRAFEAFCAGKALPLPARRRMLLVLDEILSNVVHHGGGPTSEPIELTFAWEADRLVVEVSDAARAFNPLDVPAPDTTLSLEARVPGGLGIALVRAMLDRVEYRRSGDRNVLTLTLDTHLRTGDPNGHS